MSVVVVEKVASTIVVENRVENRCRKSRRRSLSKVVVEKRVGHRLKGTRAVSRTQKTLQTPTEIALENFRKPQNAIAKTFFFCFIFNDFLRVLRFPEIFRERFRSAAKMIFDFWGFRSVGGQSDFSRWPKRFSSSRHRSRAI